MSWLFIFVVSFSDVTVWDLYILISNPGTGFLHLGQLAWNSPCYHINKSFDLQIVSRGVPCVVLSHRSFGKSLLGTALAPEHWSSDVHSCALHCLTDSCRHTIYFFQDVNAVKENRILQNFSVIPPSAMVFRLLTWSSDSFMRNGASLLNQIMKLVRE